MKCFAASLGRGLRREGMGLVIAAGALLACEAEKPKASEAPAASQSAVPTAAAEPEKPRTPPKPARPTSIDPKQASERRAAIETAYSEAKGFLVAADLEETMKKNKALKDKGAALKVFDKAAKGKWVLFTGPIVNLTESGFDLGITFTPRLEGDVMGMSRQFFMVTLENVEGYAKEDFKNAHVAVLAKYEGNGKASKGYELVEAGHWK